MSLISEPFAKAPNLETTRFLIYDLLSIAVDELSLRRAHFDGYLINAHTREEGILQ
jgi:hypothetical protein